MAAIEMSSPWLYGEMNDCKEQAEKAFYFWSVSFIRSVAGSGSELKWSHG